MQFVHKILVVGWIWAWIPNYVGKGIIEDREYGTITEEERGQYNLISLAHIFIRSVDQGQNNNT